MKPDAPKAWASVSLRPTHGTARMISMPSVIPPGKADKEVFWVNTLVNSLPEMSAKVTGVVSNTDDSHGQHDVLINLQEANHIGVQVTELTSELRRKREAMRKAYLPKILALIEEEAVHHEQRVLAKLFFVASGPDLASLAKPKQVVKAIRDSDVDGPPVDIASGQCRLLLTTVGESELYVPHINNIGVDVDFDSVPRSLSGYQQAVDYLADKKTNSMSPWLLIWSTDFWRDKHRLGDDLLAYMNNVFSESTFSNVYFVETLDGKGSFEANLKVNFIKGRTG